MLKVDICGMIHLAREVDIPFWEFEIATGVRQTIDYPDMSLEELCEFTLRAQFQLPNDSESAYAIQLALIGVLSNLAGKAETDEEIVEVIHALPIYYIPAGDIVWEKKKQKEKPDWLKQHKKLLQVEHAKRNGELECCETAEEAWELFSRRFDAEYPLNDTHTEKALLKIIELTDDVVMLKRVREKSLVWHESRLASVRKIAALTGYVNRGL